MMATLPRLTVCLYLKGRHGYREIRARKNPAAEKKDRGAFKLKKEKTELI